MIFEDDDSYGTLEEISRELIHGLPEVLKDPHASDPIWTKEVTRRLHDMGKNRNLYVCCHGSTDQGEWLLEVIWMTTPDWKIVLAAESEWGSPAAIEEDFGKLMSVKAHRKLLLFCTKSHGGADAIVKRLEAMMLAYPYHLAGEEYMAVEVTAPGAFRYGFEVPRDGRLESVVFSQMGAPLPWPWR